MQRIRLLGACSGNIPMRAPNYFGLTIDISSAVVLDSDWRKYQVRIAEDFIYNVDFDNDSFKINIMGSSGITAEAFISWAYIY